MHKVPLQIIALLILFVGGRAQTHAAESAAVEGQRVFLSLGTRGLPAAARRVFQDSIIRGLGFGGYDVGADEGPNASAIGGAIGACADAPCIRAIAQVHRATFVVQASIVSPAGPDARMTYTLKMEAFTASTGESIAERHTTCDACDESLAAHLGYLLGAEIGHRIAETGRRNAVAAAPTPTVTPAVAPAPAPSPPVAITPAAAPGLSAPNPRAKAAPAPGADLLSRDLPLNQGRSASSKVLPGLAIGAGVLALVASAVLLAQDGKGTCTVAAPDRQCPEVYDTKTQGIVSGVAGLALGGFGVWRLASAPDEPAPVQLWRVAGARAIAVGGAF
jgi:hypothetical protein